jgi:hypothetical protein
MLQQQEKKKEEVAGEKEREKREESEGGERESSLDVSSERRTIMTCDKYAGIFLFCVQSCEKNICNLIYS